MCEICLAVVLRPPMGTVAGSCGSRPARALWSLRRPPHRRHLVADRWLGALSPCCPAGSCRRHSNFARNSPAACSNIECASLGLQRFRVVSKSDRGKLCAKFVWSVCCCRHPRVPRSPFGTAAGSRYPRAPRPGPATPRVSSALVGRVVLSWLAPTLPRIRYKILPAWCCANQSGTKLSLHAEKAPKLSHFGCAGRVLYRACGEGGCAGRVLYRTCGEGGCAGRVLYRRGAAWLLLGE